MCGRIGQFSAWQAYIEAMKVFRDVVAVGHRPRFNVGPGTRAAVIRPGGYRSTMWNDLLGHSHRFTCRSPHIRKPTLPHHVSDGQDT